MTNARSAKKQPANLTVDSSLLREARALQINLSQVFEERLRDVIREKRQRRWLEENLEAFSAYERFVEKHGVFNEDDREW